MDIPEYIFDDSQIKGGSRYLLSCNSLPDLLLYLKKSHLCFLWQTSEEEFLLKALQIENREKYVPKSASDFPGSDYTATMPCLTLRAKLIGCKDKNSKKLAFFGVSGTEIMGAKQLLSLSINKSGVDVLLGSSMGQWDRIAENVQYDGSKILEMANAGYYTRLNPIFNGKHMPITVSSKGVLLSKPLTMFQIICMRLTPHLFLRDSSFAHVDPKLRFASILEKHKDKELTNLFIKCNLSFECGVYEAAPIHQSNLLAITLVYSVTKSTVYLFEFTSTFTC